METFITKILKYDHLPGGEELVEGGEGVGGIDTVAGADHLNTHL